ncbi:60S ribosomal protein L7a [Encephalitozoon hellem ATCC 50504]|uniref:60S ribosomal protein L8 n=1 Tax=Encephalitozoon hellem TaxID=27973 RepID=A0A9Q9C954_ENCHE|nr:60S ribosomal protein L7a [Encephalitozoon hellem ATCC 50504]AFM97823.1 60S ribosomal protein L7a [Encephalitozoon hellem ATCC 50504]UTX42598.1 ribosomal protein L8 [Encephalitozoon hellem]WEL38054.1 ribosomal protein L7A [Encephalitozoon hellem]|eukprot:XP_003886804.1 60S ribosomal protein L7a [Encephalitozoon hellem ATCC 50504]
MVLGKVKKIPIAAPKLTKEQKMEKELLIKKKITKLANAIRIPPAINQFKTFLSEDDTKKFVDLFMKYRPENREEKRARLSSEDPKKGPKPILVKFGLKHVTNLIETKKAKLVLISASVDPIEVVIFLPTLCRKMGVSYAIVENSTILGRLVNLKSTSCVCLCDVRPEDEATFKEMLGIANATFLDSYETHLSTWGGGSRKQVTGEQ